MLNIVKVGGLSTAISAGIAGLPFPEALSMLIEELASAASEVKDGIKRLEQIAVGQVLGNAEAAKIALLNATSQHLSTDEKIVEIRRAKQLYEKCYAEMLNIPAFGKQRAEIAFCLAGCNASLGINDRRDYWFDRSANDFRAFGEVIFEGDDWQKVTALKVAKHAGIITCGLGIGAIGFFAPYGAAIIAVKIVFFGGTAAIAGLGTTAKTGDELQKIEKLKAQLKTDQQAALVSLQEVEQVIASINEAR